MSKMMEAYLDEADQLSAEAFKEKYAPGFLVVQGEETLSSSNPISVDFRQQATTVQYDGGARRMLNNEVHDLSQYRGRKEVSIGRGLDVDLFLADPTVSRLHATLTWSKSGRVYVQHSGGRSPTLVDDDKADEVALEVDSGSTLHFGKVALSYLSPEDFQRMLWRINSAQKLSNG